MANWVSGKVQAGDVSTISLTLGILMGGSKCRECELEQEVFSEHIEQDHKHSM